METVHRPRSAAEWATFAVAVLLVLLGLPLLIMGAQLAALGGSLYYVLFGATIITGGVLMVFGHVAGAFVYLAAWLCARHMGFLGSRNGWLGTSSPPVRTQPCRYCCAAHHSGSASYPAQDISQRKCGMTRKTTLLAATIVCGLPFLLAPVTASWAQVPSKNEDPPGERSGASKDALSHPGSWYGAPSPSAPQAGGVNAANIPDGPPAPPSEATPAVDQESSHPAHDDWAAYGRDSNATRYSPLDQITPENVGQLRQAFVYHTGSKPGPGQANKWAAETTPIKVGDGLYMCSAMNDMMRIDPATGKEVWRFKAGVKYESIPYTAACKGVTYYTSSTVPEGQPCHNRILEGTLDMRLIEVDAETGRKCEGFGYHGEVNLMKGMGESVPGFVSITAPVPVVNGAVVTNQEVLDGQRRWAPSGVIRGYDAETGRFLWAWDVNRPNDHGEPKEGEHYSRGTPNSWATMTGDNALGLVYVPTGNSAADYYSAMRSPEENAVSSSIVAIDVKTGSPRWVFQTVHKDVWDYDMGSQVTMIDMPTADGTVPALIVPSKRGQTFVLDRRTGKPVLPVEERPAPTATDVPNDPRSQPSLVGRYATPRFP